MGLCLVLSVGTTQSKRHPKRQKNSKSATKSSAAIHHDRTKHEKELAKLRAEIKTVQRQLAEHELREKKSRKNLGAYDKRTQALKERIASLQGQVRELEHEKNVVDVSIVKTTSTLDTLKSVYATSVRYLYTHGGIKQSTASASLLELGSAREQDRNAYYAHLIGEAHSLNHDRLDSARKSLVENKAEIVESLDAQRSLIDQNAEERTTIEAKQRAEADQLRTIQQDRDRLKQILAKRLASAKKLESIIDDLVMREDKARVAAKSRLLAEKKHHTKTSHKAEDPAIYSEETDVHGRVPGPHSLGWPTGTHRIKQGFGEHTNNTYHTVTMNLGIDIAAPSGSAVTAAASGDVSLVSSLPSYGTIIVLRHAGGLHTVYADLSGTSVRRGAHVNAGQRIGTSGENTELGPLLHFEVWKGRSKQNPLKWLK